MLFSSPVPHVMGLAGGHFCSTANSLLEVSVVLERQCSLVCPDQLAAVRVRRCIMELVLSVFPGWDPTAADVGI